MYTTNFTCNISQRDLLDVIKSVYTIKFIYNQKRMVNRYNLLNQKCS